MDSGKRLLTVGEAAAALGLGRSMVYALVMRGDIVSLKIGKARRIPAAALDTFVNARIADSIRNEAGARA